MNRATRLGLGFAAAATLCVLVSDLVPRAKMTGKPQSGAAAASAVSSVGYRSPSERHKVSVSDPQAAQSLKAQGGRVIADYGSFVMFEVNDAVANSLISNQNTQIVD